MTNYQCLNVGCGPHRTDFPGWINTDVIHEPGLIEPDFIVSPEDPLPFEAATFDRIYMGHVLEHIPWDKTVNFLKLAKQTLKKNGELFVVCPDVNRALQNVLDGTGTIDWYNGVIEDDTHYQQNPVEWFGARHCWNAYEARIERVLQLAGYDNITTIDITDPKNTDGWPITSHANWQCGVKATSL